MSCRRPACSSWSWPSPGPGASICRARAPCSGAVDSLESSLARASAVSDAPPGLTGEELAERARIIETLAAAYGNQTRAAEVLGISRRWLTTKMARYRIPRPRKR